MCFHWKAICLDALLTFNLYFYDKLYEFLFLLEIRPCLHLVCKCFLLFPPPSLSLHHFLLLLL